MVETQWDDDDRQTDRQTDKKRVLILRGLTKSKVEIKDLFLVYKQKNDTI